MRLGELIDALQACDPKKTVQYDTGEFPDYLASWRGIYRDLALGHHTVACSVGALLDMCEQAVGGTFEGYKGGDFVMDRESAVWVDNWGASTCRIIRDIEDTKYTVLIHTYEIPAEHR